MNYYTLCTIITVTIAICFNYVYTVIDVVLVSCPELCGTLVLRDHFVTRGEPTLFDIEEEDSISQKSFEREQVLHYWMSEMQRLVFARKLLKIGHKEQEAFVSVYLLNACTYVCAG